MLCLNPFPVSETPPSSSPALPISPRSKQVSFRSMQTPAVLTFLHMLSAAGGIYLASRYDVYERVRLSPSAIRGGSVSVVLYATQV